MIRRFKGDFGYRVLVGILIACLAACSGDEPLTYEPPPVGTPDTPYWYQLGDSVFWFTSVDSLASAQVLKDAPKDAKSDVLFALRDLGWRMTVERTRMMQRPGEPQDLSQQLFAMEQVEGAVSPVRQYGRFRETFWQTEEPVLLALMPGLKASDGGLPQYFWPASLVVVWQTGVTAQEGKNLIDSLGCEILTSPALVRQYWIDRSWACSLPAGADLFRWLRLLNDDPRILLAHPVTTRRDPPVPDQRIVRRMTPLVQSEPEPAIGKLSDPLKIAYEIAFFSGNTIHVKQAAKVTLDQFRFRIVITLPADDLDAYAALIEEYGGEMIQSRKYRIEAWVPYARLLDLAADDRVKNIKEVRTDNLLGN
jgi:hypothetical protein